jgi:hypothetical protein
MLFFVVPVYPTPDPASALPKFGDDVWFNCGPKALGEELDTVNDTVLHPRNKDTSRAP